MFRLFLRASRDFRYGAGVGSSNEKRTPSGTSGGEWLVNVSDDVVVPLTTLEVVDGLRARRLSERSLVWRIGMHDWTPIIDVPQLRLAAGVRTRPPAKVGMSQAPSFAQAELQRRRNTLPFGFPALRDPASAPQPGGVGSRSSPPTSASATPPDPSEPLAIYERPMASLTFSESGRAAWEGNTHPPLTPVPPVAGPLARKSIQSTIPNSLAPTTAEAREEPERGRARGDWGDLDELLASERRTDRLNSRRAVLWAAVGSAALASGFSLWLLRSPAAQVAEGPARTVQASEAPAPALAPTLEAVVAPSASVSKNAQELVRVAPKPVVGHVARRPKLTTRVARTASTASTSDSQSTPSDAIPAIAVAPVPATEAPSVTQEAVPAPIEPIAPIAPIPPIEPGPP